MNIGDYIKRLRNEKGLTQEELGNLVGVKRAAVNKWESGMVQNLKRTTIKRLSDIFEVSPASFIDDCAEPSNISALPTTELSDREKNLIADYRQLNEAGQDKVDEYSKDLLNSGNYSADDEYENVQIAARKGGGTIKIKKNPKKSIFDAPDYR